MPNADLINRPWAIALGRVKARKEGKKHVFVAHFQLNGTHAKQSLKTSRKEVAMAAAVQLENQLLTGTFQPPTPNKTIAEAVREFLDSRRSDGCKPKTLGKYATELNCFVQILADTGATYLRQITEPGFEHYREQRRRTNLRGDVDTIAEKTVFAACMTVKSFLNWCTDRRGYLLRNPLIRLPITKPPSVKQPAATQEQVNKILERAVLPLVAQLAFLAFTGARSGEMALMLGQNVDMAGNWLHIPTLKRKKTEIITHRKVPLHPRLKTYLQDYFALYSIAPKTPLFQSAPSRKYAQGGHGVNTRHLCERYVKLAQSLGYTVGRKNLGLVIHSLRHFFETFCTNSGVPQRVVDAWLGHTGDRSMGAVYYNLSDADSQMFMAKVPF